MKMILRVSMSHGCCWLWTRIVQLGRVAFRVEDFQPDRMKVTATLARSIRRKAGERIRM